MQVAQVARKRGTGVGVEVRGLWFVRYERERACCMVMWLWGSGAGRRAGIRFVTVAVADTGGRYLKSVPLNNKNKEPCSNTPTQPPAAVPIIQNTSRVDGRLELSRVRMSVPKAPEHSSTILWRWMVHPLNKSKSKRLEKVFWRKGAVAAAEQTK